MDLGGAVRNKRKDRATVEIRRLQEPLLRYLTSLKGELKFSSSTNLVVSGEPARDFP